MSNYLDRTFQNVIASNDVVVNGNSIASLYSQVQGLSAGVTESQGNGYWDALGAASTAQTNAESFATSAISTEVSNRNSAISSAVSTEVSNRNSAISSAISTAASNYDAVGAASTAQSAAQSYADGLASNYDASGAASSAQSAAQSYADGLASNYDASGAASSAQSAAQSYADGLASNYDASGAASSAVAPFVAGNIMTCIDSNSSNTSLLATLDLSAYSLANSNSMVFVNCDGSFNFVKLPTSPADGFNLYFYNVGAHNDIQLSIDGSTSLESVAPTNCVKAIAWSGSYYFLAN